MRHAADGASDRDDGERRSKRDQSVAHGIAQQRGEQQWLARETGGRDGQRDGQRRHHHGVEADQQARDGVRHGEASADVGQESHREHLGGHRQAAGQAQ
jgi:hypothetical protein